MALRFAANLSMLYGELPFLDRFQRAAEAGFQAVEFLFPYEAGVEAIRAQAREHGLSIALFNLPAGNVEVGEWGTLGVPARQDYFRWSLETALRAAVALDCKRLHALFGNRVKGLETEAQFRCAIENLSWAGLQAERAGVTLLVEALNPIDFPDFFLHHHSMALELVQEVDHPHVRLQFDVYHAQMTAGNLINTLSKCFAWIGHVQIADVPGRHEPGTGEIRFPAIFNALEELGYVGYIGLEYRPTIDTDASLTWLSEDWRGSHESG